MVALTPVAAMMFRYNNPDALLALLLTGGDVRHDARRSRRRRRNGWCWLAALIGFGFITKMLQAFLIVPVWPSSTCLLHRPVGGGASGRRSSWELSVVVAGGWWVAVVALTPASDRPYVGGSQDNSILNLIFGYNGFGRLTGNETGSVGGRPDGGLHVGTDRLDPALQSRVRQHDVVARSRCTRHGRGAAGAHHPPSTYRP